MYVENIIIFTNKQFKKMCCAQNVQHFVRKSKAFLKYMMYTDVS